jgi:hypothetical protein
MDELNIERFRITPETERVLRAARQKRRAASITARFLQMAASMTPEKESELASMSYKAFLETEYWWILGQYVRLLHGDHCDHCPHALELQVHHRTYTHVGSEYRHLEDLALLCDSCHRAEHGG